MLFNQNCLASPINNAVTLYCNSFTKLNTEIIVRCKISAVVNTNV